MGVGWVAHGRSAYGDSDGTQSEHGRSARSQRTVAAHGRSARLQDTRTTPAHLVAGIARGRNQEQAGDRHSGPRDEGHIAALEGVARVILRLGQLERACERNAEAAEWEHDERGEGWMSTGK